MVMNNKKSIFGVVESAKENKDYTGLKTETAKVTVDNVNRQISVDVDFASMLGETNQTAYPGLQGKINRELILDLEKDLAAETARAKESESDLQELIKDVAWDIDFGDRRVAKSVDEETARAKKQEQELKTSIENLATTVELNKEQSQTSIEQLTADVADQNTQLYDKIDETSEELTELVRDTKNDLYKQIRDNQENIDHITDVVSENKQELTENIAKVNASFQANLTAEVTKLTQADSKLTESIQDLATATQQVDKELQKDIDEIENNFARKTYVQEQLVLFTKLSKQIVESVDLEANRVVINSKEETPIDGVLYLVKDDSAKVDDIYREYTTIESQLTLIGDTSTNLEGYATEKWVKDQQYLTDHQDLSDYAKRAFVTDQIKQSEEELKSYVDASIDAIPEVDLTPFAKIEQLPTKVSELENDADYAQTSDIPSLEGLATETYVDDAIADKLDVPETPPDAAGKVLRVLSVNEDGTFTCEWADAPESSVSDVLINGESIVVNGAADIKVVSDIGWNEPHKRPGLVRRQSPGYARGVYINELGYVELDPADEYMIDNRTKYSRNPITTGNLNYAVKAAMCDGKGEAWTANEQSVARERIGIDEPYELIETFTIDEESVSMVEREAEPDGTVYNFKKVMVCIVTYDTNMSGLCKIVYAHRNKYKFDQQYSAIHYNSGYNQTFVFCQKQNGLWLIEAVLSHTNGVTRSVFSEVDTINTAYNSITGLRISFVNKFIVGTEIKIYGVRA